jgi:hypothetical protein
MYTFFILLLFHSSPFSFFSFFILLLFTRFSFSHLSISFSLSFSLLIFSRKRKKKENSLPSLGHRKSSNGASINDDAPSPSYKHSPFTQNSTLSFQIGALLTSSSSHTTLPLCPSNLAASSETSMPMLAFSLISCLETPSSSRTSHNLGA